MSLQNNLGLPGFAQPTSVMGQFNQHSFMIEQALSRLSTAMPVIVTAVQAGGTGPVGLVDIQPLVSQVDASGNTYEQPIIPNVPYNRLQGGSNAVVIDPAVGDIGIAVFSSRDMSSVVNARQSAPPGSARMYDIADAMYIGGILNAAPTQYIQFSGSGIKIYSPTVCEVDAPTVTVNATGLATITSPTVTVQGNLVVNGSTALNGNITQTAGTSAGTATLVGPLNVTNDVTAGSISLQGHKHSGVTTGGGNTGGAF